MMPGPGREPGRDITKEDPVSLYSISLFLHIVGALGLFAVLGLEWAGLYHLRRATGTGQAREWVRLLAAPRALGAPTALLILIPGIHMSAVRWGPQGWILVGLGGMVVIAALGALVGGRRVGAIARALPVDDSPIPPALGRQLQDPVLARSLWLRTALFLGIVFIMSTQPTTAGALATMGVAAVAGVTAVLPARGGDRRQARVAGSER
jgi:hypothetical protein